MFFAEGDELWEISKTIQWSSEADPFEEETSETSKAKPWGGDWVVWNARSRTVIGSGSWDDIRRLEQSLSINSIPTLQRTRFEFVATAGEAAEASRRSELVLTSRDSEEASAEVEGVRAKTTSQSDMRHALSHSAILFFWPGKEKGVRWEVSSRSTVADGVRTRIAKGRDHDENWELYATISTETADGTPLHGERWIEAPSGPVLWAHYPIAGSYRESFEGDLILKVYPVRDDFMNKLGGGLPGQAVFVEGSSAVNGARRWYLDVRPLLEQNGVKLVHPEAWIGFDPSTSSVVALADRENQDLLEGILDMGRSPVRAVWLETNPESGGWGILSRSGEKASISRSNQGETVLACDIEPTIGGNEQVIDLRYQFDVMNGQKQVGRMQSATTLFPDRPQVVGKVFSSDGKEIEVVMTASISP
ncbi:hypothetical protein OJ996_07760 [Luteolibacter sp. GHJ8]|uniref:Uncharacterized protein n=1 Tax=Luteolibacter rhizosphaerae TaxID=2989719 RepID=A0ABT3G1M1_9BACT|nr:hypothetical protein [Luteolibacter rhizosphaerae]MCW1913464.1 hypothetical protein [Luteolibacter rhizosphaerae]